MLVKEPQNKKSTKVKHKLFSLLHTCELVPVILEDIKPLDEDVM